MGRCRRGVVCIAMLLTIIVYSFPCVAGETRRPVVVLDPGHGGMESGVKGPYGALEKDVVLAVALELRHQLGPGYDVRLTRESDRALSLSGRVERANHVAGELLLSLHLGGGLSREVNRISVMVQQGDRSSLTRAGVDPGLSWRAGHVPYINASRDVATDLKRSLMILDGYDGVSVSRAPLAISVGARMPVALVELGNLINPAQESRISDAAHVRRVASALASAIDAFFTR